MLHFLLMSENKLLSAINSALQTGPSDELELKSKPSVMRTFRMPSALAAWMEIVAERTGLTLTDILEYSLMAAASPDSNLQFYQLAMLHKTKNTKRGKKWSVRQIRALIQEDLNSCQSIYGQPRDNAIEAWKLALTELPQSKYPGRGRPRKLTLL